MDTEQQRRAVWREEKYREMGGGEEKRIFVIFMGYRVVHSDAYSTAFKGTAKSFREQLSPIQNLFNDNCYSYTLLTF